ncbi:unnamed protein product [[Actinomadura] parvosata subsp. kistnae]|uniref:SAM-dependent methyltransferase n=1 Tax=[Actinomadura] parvosata TaxID=1955412 RepID=UPI000D28E05C|nr:unnamed protein product [Actinomadura parvosata subsp. kistnae]
MNDTPAAGSTTPPGDLPPRRHRDEFEPTARAYNAGLFGKDHYEEDKAGFQELTEVAPLLPIAVSENRHFGFRGVTAAALGGVDQFLNLGLGFPTPDGISIADVIRPHQPLARVVHVDASQVVASHGRAMLARVDNVSMVHADAREPDLVLKEAAELLDLSKPLCIVATALLHFWPDEQEPAAVLYEYMRAVPAGYLVLSHACGEEMDALRYAQLRSIYQRRFAPIYPRTRAEVAAMLHGLDVLEPGLVEASQWRSNDRRIDVGDAYFLAAVAKFGHYVVTFRREDRTSVETGHPLSEAS